MFKLLVRQPSGVNMAKRYSYMKLCREVWDGDKICKAATEREWEWMSSPRELN